MFGFFPIGLCRRQPRNRQIHQQVCWQRHRISGVVGKERDIGFVGFLGKVEPKWCRKYRKWLCCEIFVTKSKFKASLAVWRNFCLTFFREGCSPSRRAAPSHKDHECRFFGVTSKQKVFICSCANAVRHYLKSNNVGRHFCPDFQRFCLDI